MYIYVSLFNFFHEVASIMWLHKVATFLFFSSCVILMNEHVHFIMLQVHCWVLAWDIAVVVLFGRYFEPLWSFIEIVRFFIIVTTVPVVLSSLTYLGWYLVLRDPDLLFENHLHGFATFIAALTVALTQMEADVVLVSSPFGKLRIRHLPLSLLACSIVLRLLGIVDTPFPVLFFWGTIVSWIYLRFYQAHMGNQRGDMADSFLFAT